MRMTAFLTGLLVAVLFTVSANSPAVQAESQNNQQATAVQLAQSVPTTPTPPPKLVEIKAGDYLAKIAEENQTTYPRLYDANESIKDPNVIYPGEKLRVPLPDEQLPSRSAPVAPAPEKTVVTPAPTIHQKTQSRPRTATPSPQPAPRASVGNGSVWDKLAQCESGGNWSINTGNGYYGGLQFSLASWRGVGGSGLPSEASREEQIQRGIMLQARQGWGAWPACTAKLGIR